MRRQKYICIWITLLLFLAACDVRQNTDTTQESSFTTESTYSYDGKYLAEQSVKYDDGIGVNYIRVDIIRVESNQTIAILFVDRARDFHGICWESDSYNFWVQSGDMGVVGYLYEEGTWNRDIEGVMERPSDIVSKYDE